MRIVLFVSLWLVCFVGASTDDSLNFLFLGDWGTPGVNQSLIAESMGNWSRLNNAKFVVALGDNFYCELQFIIGFCFLLSDHTFNYFRQRSNFRHRSTME